ncbi:MULTISPECIES: phenylacetate--CoA ligase PaaK [Microbacterium]|uniref:Phenylacetate-coenzyme A ligase n=1 Tax=Microbacterium maritypicum TaxID=33918 RepID=A0AAD3X3C0_MICMQ|nr:MULTISPECIES: phenylacetate--CoA ligase PaaK [Microbacterium]KAB1883839.1 phenylacetate--CoA ligase [Microbacterium liquefaciens]KQV00926.1 phenylacetate--CoA ligase [Microbacterium sp. Root322]KQY74901.1 phenylacetate--CoA ligase [Microbacterium sp. Root1433D1]WKT88052.1 phenylacetate--CoA ligase PaaK [Microbacterium liquefaciens]
MTTATSSRVRPPAAAELDAEERMGRDEIAALQLARLQQTVRHAYANVPLYTRKLDEAGVRPEDIRTLDDVQLLPFTTKEDLRETYPFGMFAVPMSDVARIHASSGTTGRPTVVGYTRGDLDRWASLVARSLRASGIRRGMKVHNAYGYGLFTGGLGAHAGIEALGATAIPMSGGQTARQVQLILDFEPDAILCTPSYLLTIADAMAAQGVDPRSTSLKVAVLGAEPWSNEMRHELEQRLGIDALDIYGLSEVMGPGVGNECLETKDGPHLWEDHFLPEIIDGDSGAALPDGELGELVFTSLTKEAFPVIRYRTRDLTRLLPGTARPGMRRMEKITGRNDDMIILRGVNLFPTQIEELVLGIEQLTPHFILELSKEGRMDTLKVRIERHPDLSVETCQSAAEVLAQRIKIFVGSTVAVQLAEPGTLPRSEGKYKRVYDLR